MDGARTHVNSNGKNPLYQKLRGDWTRDAESCKTASPTHYRLSCSGPMRPVSIRWASMETTPSSTVTWCVNSTGKASTGQDNCLLMTAETTHPKALPSEIYTQRADTHCECQPGQHGNHSMISDDSQVLFVFGNVGNGCTHCRKYFFVFWFEEGNNQLQASYKGAHHLSSILHNKVHIFVL